MSPLEAASTPLSSAPPALLPQKRLYRRNGRFHRRRHRRRLGRLQRHLPHRQRRHVRRQRRLHQHHLQATCMEFSKGPGAGRDVLINCTMPVNTPENPVAQCQTAASPRPTSFYLTYHTKDTSGKPAASPTAAKAPEPSKPFSMSDEEVKAFNPGTSSAPWPTRRRWGRGWRWGAARVDVATRCRAAAAACVCAHTPAMIGIPPTPAINTKPSTKATRPGTHRHQQRPAQHPYRRPARHPQCRAHPRPARHRSIRHLVHPVRPRLTEGHLRPQHQRHR